LQKSAAQSPFQHSLLVEQTWPGSLAEPGLAQAPAPLHTLLPPHAGLPSRPLGTYAHVPTLPGAVQVTAHWPVHALLQQKPPLQKVLAQSVVPPHTLPVPHAAQAPPPQSVSVSVPFLTPSVHVGWQTLPVQRPPAQSPLILQARPGPHFFAQLPPQSTSVSVPFFLPSVQLMQTPPVQSPFAQSLAAAQAWPSAHGGQVAPPQSTSVSVPSFTLFVQLAHMPPTQASPDAQPKVVPLSTKQVTQVPEASQTPALPLQLIPLGTAFFWHAPLTQAQEKQSPSAPHCAAEVQVPPLVLEAELEVDVAPPPPVELEFVDPPLPPADEPPLASPFGLRKHPLGPAPSAAP
jgi:hypothetical protein